MKCVVTNTNYNYARGIASFSATVQICTDDYDPATETGTIIWQDGVSTRINTEWPSGWYEKAKTDLMQQAEYIRDTFVYAFSKISQETGKTSIDDILADIVSTLEADLNGGS